MYRSGAFVAAQLSDVDRSQVQPNGVDLTVASVAVPTEPGRLGRADKGIAERRTVDPDAGDPPTYHLDPGAYVVGYDERIAVPDGHVGFVLPRSSLLRNGCTLETAVWDTGYEGRGEGLLVVHNDLDLEQGARIGQFVLTAADHAGSYDGTYQGEGLDEGAVDAE